MISNPFADIFAQFTVGSAQWRANSDPLSAPYTPLLATNFFPALTRPVKASVRIVYSAYFSPISWRMKNARRLNVRPVDSIKSSSDVLFFSYETTFAKMQQIIFPSDVYKSLFAH